MFAVHLSQRIGCHKSNLLYKIIKTMKKLLLLTTALLTMLLSSCGSNGGNDEWYDLGLIPIRQGNQFGYINWEGQ